MRRMCSGMMVVDVFSLIFYFFFLPVEKQTLKVRFPRKLQTKTVRMYNIRRVLSIATQPLCHRTINSLTYYDVCLTS